MIRSSAILSVWVLVGCVKVNSTGIATSDMSARFEAKANGTGDTDVKAYLNNGDVDSLEYIQLAGGDTLTASANGTKRAMASDSLFGVVTYTTKFNQLD